MFWCFTPKTLGLSPSDPCGIRCRESCELVWNAPGRIFGACDCWELCRAIIRNLFIWQKL